MENRGSRIFEGLNSEQKEAVASTDGPVLIIAGAGSGKTRVLTSRIAYMLELGVEPQSILALTFTKKAAGEMRERVSAMAGHQARRIYMGTFHSVFIRFLREYADRLGYPQSFTIYDTSDSRSAVKACVKELGLDEKVYKPAEVLSRISMAKNNLVTESAYRNNPQIVQNDFASRRGQICEIYTLYARKCKMSGVMDFDDILLNMNILLRDNPDALESLRERFRYILVDEYQDTNFAQYLIVRKLSEIHRNICVVGDDSQSIYAFRGARVENILNFRKDYPESRTFRLEQNYRSTQTIVNAANSVIEKNKERLEKKCFSVGEEGEKIHVLRAYTEQEEAMLITTAVSSRIFRDRAEYQDFAVLYRTNAQSRALEEALRKRNIPYKIFSGNSFYDKAEIKDAIAYFKLAVNPTDDEAFKRIVNVPSRGIGDTSLAALATAASARSVSLWDAVAMDDLSVFGLKPAAVTKIRAFRAMMQPYVDSASSSEASVTADSLILASGLYAMYKEDRSPEGQARCENIEELMNGVKAYVEEETNTRNELAELEGEGCPTATVTLSDYLENISLMSDADTKDGEDSANRVTLMTIHSSKGLEFPYVFIAGMEENLFPSAGVASERDVEEERRLFYVAITRAARAVTLSLAASRMKYGQHQTNAPSRFLREIDPQYLDDPKASFGHGRTADRVPAPSRSLRQPAVPARPPRPADPSFVADPVLSFRTGMRVEHNRFGAGTITSMSGGGSDLKAEIDFDDYGKKTLLMKFAKLRRI